MKYKDILQKLMLISRRFPGGFRSPISYILLLVLVWAFRAFLKERGWWFKKSLANKHIFLTGAGSGLGRRMAIKFALHGAKLTISDIDEKSVLETKKIIEKMLSKVKVKTQVLAIKLDVSSRNEVRDVAQEAKKEIGDVDILINNAGIVQGKKLWDLDEFMIHKTMVVNAESHFWLINEFIGPMLKKNDGHIVSIASVAGIAGCPDMTDYCASKFAAFGLMESLRIEFKRENINIKTTTICPYFINTGMFDGVTTSMAYPILNQDDVVWRIVNAVMQEEAQITIPWSCGQLTNIANLLPVGIKDFCSWAFVGWHAMEKFKGRI